MSGERFWEFSNRVYRLPGVAESCLLLQDEHGADVNVVLWCCWTGTTIGRISGETLDHALELSDRWSGGVVKPLRAARRWLKEHDGESELRDRVKADELEAERIQQLRLEALVGGLATDRPGPDAVVENLDLWLKRAEIELETPGRDALDRVTAASGSGDHTR